MYMGPFAKNDGNGKMWVKTVHNHETMTQDGDKIES